MKRSYRSASIVQNAIDNQENNSKTAAAENINQLLTTAMNPEQHEQHQKTISINPVNDQVSNLRSISPPPYSPLTPLIRLTEKMNANCDDIIEEGERVESPIQQMSPETQLLFDALCEPMTRTSSPNSIKSSENFIFDVFPFGEDSDDSVRDPDYLIIGQEDVDSKSSSIYEDSDKENENANKLQDKKARKVQKKEIKMKPDKIDIQYKGKSKLWDKKPGNLQDQQEGLVQDKDVSERQGKESSKVPDKEVTKKQEKEPSGVQFKETGDVQNMLDGDVQDMEAGGLQDMEAGGLQNKEIGEVQQEVIIGKVQDREAGGKQDTRAGRVQNLEIGEVQQDMMITDEVQDRGASEVQDMRAEGIQNIEAGKEQQANISEGRPKKGRKRKHKEYTLAERKKRKYSNLPYQGKTTFKPAKVFYDYACGCKNQCFLTVSKEVRQKEFEKYISLGSYEAQLLYIVCCVKETKKKRTYVCKNTKTGKKKPREYCRTYMIDNNQVCREMFIKTFQITPQKITISLKKNRGNNLTDRRGQASGGWNRTPQEDIDFVCKVINALPKYESHYRRARSNDAMYLKTGMTIHKIYDLYVYEHKQEMGGTKNILSFDLVKKIFYKHFNLRFKHLKKDTCNKCDTIAARLKSHNLSQESRESLISEKQEHQKVAESLREQMNKDIEQAKTDDSFECITFDMQKTLPLPQIPTNIIFYKRQLWFYDCGIHVGSNNKGYCFVWLEGEAGRGAQEVGSCLTKFISTNIKPSAKHLTLWSDSCGGQNRNIKIVLMLKVILDSHPSLKTISLNFLESGHSFLPNDTDFGKIESHLQHFERIYTAQDYINIIKGSTKKNPLEVVKMQKDDFLGTSAIEKNIVNRKTFSDKTKVSWLKTKQIMLKKENLHTIFMRKGMHDEYSELNIEKKVKGKSFPISKKQLVPLWPSGKQIAQPKLDDLKSIFHLIPEDCLDYYKQLTGNLDIADDVDGFGGTPDFNLEHEEDQEENDTTE